MKWFLYALWDIMVLQQGSFCPINLAPYIYIHIYLYFHVLVGSELMRNSVIWASTLSCPIDDVFSIFCSLLNLTEHFTLIHFDASTHSISQVHNDQIFLSRKENLFFCIRFVCMVIYCEFAYQPKILLLGGNSSGSIISKTFLIRTAPKFCNHVSSSVLRLC